VFGGGGVLAIMQQQPQHRRVEQPQPARPPVESRLGRVCNLGPTAITSPSLVRILPPSLSVSSHRRRRRRRRSPDRRRRVRVPFRRGATPRARALCHAVQNLQNPVRLERRSARRLDLFSVEWEGGERTGWERERERERESAHSATGRCCEGG
jgi:hypothetical protein